MRKITKSAGLLALLLLAGSAAGQNVVENPSFDGGLLDWTSVDGAALFVSDEDSIGTPGGKSVIVENTAAAANNIRSIRQCVSISGGKNWTLLLRRKITTSPGVAADFYIVRAYFSTPDCSGPIITALVSYPPLTSEDAVWRTESQSPLGTSGASTSAPAGTASMLLYLGGRKVTAGGSLRVQIDDVWISESKLKTATIPASASVGGANGAFFSTDLWIGGAGRYETTLLASLRALPGLPASGTLLFSAPRRGTAFTSDFLAAGFGLAGTAGAIEWTYDAAAGEPSFLSRTFTPKRPGPTTGSALAALPSDEARTRAVLIGLGSNGGNLSGGSRTNVGFFNPGTSTVTVTVELFAGDGTRLGSAKEYAVAARSPFQVNDVFAAVGAGGTVTDNAWAIVSSTQPVFSYSTVIDNQSGDSVIATGRPAGAL